MDETHCDGLDDFLTGELPLDRRAEFQRHLRECQLCRDAADDWQRLCLSLAAATDHLELPTRALLEQIEIALRSRQDRKGERPRNDCGS